jgi:hypothetical protein
MARPVIGDAAGDATGELRVPPGVAAGDAIGLAAGLATGLAAGLAALVGDAAVVGLLAVVPVVADGVSCSSAPPQPIATIKLVATAPLASICFHDIRRIIGVPFEFFIEPHFSYAERRFASPQMLIRNAITVLNDPTAVQRECSYAARRPSFMIRQEAMICARRVIMCLMHCVFWDSIDVI